MQYLNSLPILVISVMNPTSTYVSTDFHQSWGSVRVRVWVGIVIRKCAPGFRLARNSFINPDSRVYSQQGILSSTQRQNLFKRHSLYLSFVDPASMYTPGLVFHQSSNKLKNWKFSHQSSFCLSNDLVIILAYTAFFRQYSFYFKLRARAAV